MRSRMTWIVLGLLSLTACGGQQTLPEQSMEPAASEPGPVVTGTVDAAPNDDDLPPNAQRVSAENVDPWPLAVDSGVLRCEGPSAVYFDAPDGTTYMVNGMAMTLDDAEDIDPIWLAGKDPEMVPKVNIGSLIDTGLELCD